MKKAILLIFLASFILPFVNADIITPGYHPLLINNYITNIDDFPDYYFLQVCNPPMPHISLIKSNKTSPYCYKFSQLDVYAVKKDRLNLQDFKNGGYLNEKKISTDENLTNYLNGLGAVRVLENLEHYKTVPDSSIEKDINNYYTINITQPNIEPNKTIKNKNNLVYYYIFIPLIAIIIVVLLLLKRRKNAVSF